MPSNANLKAAREVVASRARYARGLHRSTSTGITQPLSLRAANARHPGSSFASIQRIMRRLETGSTPRQVGRSRVLTDEEDKAIVAFLKQAFLKAAEQSRFKKSGIYPPNPKPAIAYLTKKQLQSKQAINLAFASLLPHDSRFQTAADTAKHLSERYSDTFSSPTRAGLRQIHKVITEAVILESIVTAYVDNRRARIEKRYNAKKRGKRVNLVSDFSHNISLQEIREQQEEVIAETRQKEEKAQVCNDSITFQLDPAPPNEEEEEEEEEEDNDDLPLFKPPPYLPEIPSSPPVTASSPRLPSLPPEPPSTPCPIRPQHHISGIQRIKSIITEARAAREASPGG
ncbi:hypothetical protein MRS44_011996 [Fusarium solani]|uniref:uncharacterized protein n=1 Tax=Fusarium solani TaxID=169388 RepID=UPI0032C43E6F|nr:hypothetical protein MRS44_011996 [Fusarium solani]